MCGIVGIYDLKGKAIVPELLVKMNNKIGHRGPDDDGYVLIDDRSSQKAICDFEQHTEGPIDGFNLGLGHKRLSIVDLSPLGHQPMKDEEDKVWLVFNGEIYNHITLRKQLEQLGYSFKSHSDTEVIIAAYKQWGIDFVSKLKGIFAMAIWDCDSKELYIIRDRVGVKPLYYTVQNETLYFSSEIKALLQIPSFSRRLNHKALSHYLSFLAIPAPNTLFQDIFKVAPGNYIRYKKDTEPVHIKYWDAYLETEHQLMSDAEYVDRTDELLSASVNMRMMSDVPSGVFLSGGVDSSLIVAMMSQKSDTPINTLTIGYKGLEKESEFQYARQVSKKFGTNHTELIIDGNNVEDLIRDMVYHQDEPIADPVCIPILLLSRKAKELGISVIQVGEGADELFAGYRNFRTYYKINQRLWSKLNHYPKPLKKGVAFLGKGILSATKYRKYIDYFDFMVAEKELFWSNAHKFYPSELDKVLLRNDFLNPYEFIEEKAQVVKRDNFLEKVAYQELNLRLPELLLMRVDKMTMAAAVEGRVPFLDHSLIEFAMQIPDEVKLRNDEPKYLIKKVAERYLPNDIVYRKKVGFGFPIKHFFKNGFSGFLKDSIFNSGLRNEGVINYDYVEKMFKLSESGKVNYHSHLWSLANLSMWYDLWFTDQ